MRVLAPALFVAALFAALLFGLWLGGAASPRTLLDPGVVVRYGLPIARTLVNVGLAGLLGSTVLAVWACANVNPVLHHRAGHLLSAHVGDVSPAQQGQHPRAGKQAGQGAVPLEYRTVMDVAAASAALLTVASLAVIIFTYLDVSGQSFSAGAQFGAGLGQFVTQLELGQLWLWELLLGAVTTVLAFAIRGRRATLLVLILAVVAVFPLALQGHAAGASGHSLAVNSLLVHLLGAGVWLGGLATLMVLAVRVDAARLQVLTARYSTLALFAWFGVAASGVAAAVQRVGSWSALFGTGYGQLVLLKVLLLVVLGLFGAVQRRVLIPRIADAAGSADAGSAASRAASSTAASAISKAGAMARHAGIPRAFLWFVLAELAVLAAVSGLAGALGRTATPVSLEPLREQGGKVTPAEWLTGDPLPPALTPLRYLTEWKLDPAWALLCVFAVALYLAGVVRLWRRGDRWSLGRTAAWVGGILLLFYTTNGALNAYEEYLFSVHMLEHMMLTMMIPLVLVLGAPVTLALRATERRTDGSWGGREWIMWLVQTPYARIITHPLVAAVIFAGSLWLFYFTPIARWAASEHLGHQWMIVHFLIGGFLFCLTMVGIDPLPYRFPHALRIVTLFATMASHAFFGVTLMTGSNLLLADWYGAMGRTWGDAPLQDQLLGGGIAWGIGELPTLALALVVAVQWARSDAKEQKRRDRAADRSGDAELAAYNEMLRQQAERDAARNL